MHPICPFVVCIAEAQKFTRLLLEMVDSEFEALRQWIDVAKPGKPCYTFLTVMFSNDCESRQTSFHAKMPLKCTFSVVINGNMVLLFVSCQDDVHYKYVTFRAHLACISSVRTLQFLMIIAPLPVHVKLKP